MKGTIAIVRPNGAKRNKEVIFKNNAPFINCISKINGVKIDNANEEGYDAHKVGINETEAVIPLKYLSNFCRSLNIPLINCEVKLILTWSKNCILADMTVNALADPAIVAPIELEFKIYIQNYMFQLLVYQKKLI